MVPPMSWPEQQLIEGRFMGDYKYRVFLTAGVLMALAQWAVKYLWVDEADAWAMRAENMALSVIAAWIAERYAQKKLGIHLEWLGRGARRIRPFLLSMFCLAFFAWVATPGVFKSTSVFQFYANVGIVYLLAGAFFETCNLIKAGAEK
jgi:peptidoglycan/LPS O-acetylase OafA/YrhL